LSVGIRVARVGGKSIDLAYEARSAEGSLCISGETTIVMFDFVSGASKEVDMDLREALAKYT
jgi:acyl-CoA thioesterase FadM